MKKLFFLILTLAAAALLADTIPEGTTWASLDLDTTSQTRALAPSYPIPYSTSWAKGYYDRRISVSAVQIDETSGVSFDFLTTTGEETGTYVWDYSGLTPEELPRNGTYSLQYRIFSGASTYESGASQANFTVLPEPSLGFLALAFIFGAFAKKF